MDLDFTNIKHFIFFYGFKARGWNLKCHDNLAQGLANYDPQDKQGSMSAFVNTVLLEHSFAY